jgi:hypothetical protein
MKRGGRLEVPTTSACLPRPLPPVTPERPSCASLAFKPRALCLTSAPVNYGALVDPLAEGARVVARLTPQVDVVHVFTTDRGALAQALATLRKRIAPADSIWVSWPKKASKVPSNIIEDTVRALALPLGLVDIKVCAVDETWVRAQAGNPGLRLSDRMANEKSCRSMCIGATDDT